MCTYVDKRDTITLFSRVSFFLVHNTASDLGLFLFRVAVTVVKSLVDVDS